MFTRANTAPLPCVARWLPVLISADMNPVGVPCYERSSAVHWTPLSGGPLVTQLWHPPTAGNSHGNPPRSGIKLSGAEKRSWTLTWTGHKVFPVHGQKRLLIRRVRETEKRPGQGISERRVDQAKIWTTCCNIDGRGFEGRKQMQEMGRKGRKTG